MNKRAVGGIAEELAVQYLTSNGLIIIERNYRNRFGEIDIIARDGPYLVFIEVKYRKTASAGHPEEAVNYHKMNKICRVSDHYRLCKGFAYETPCRYDVIAIEGEHINWYKNAFDYI